MKEIRRKNDAPTLANKLKNGARYTDVAGTEIVAEEKFRVMSPGRMVAKRFFRSRLSVIGLGMILFVFLFSFVGPLIVNATWGYGETQVFKVERSSSMVATATFTDRTERRIAITTNRSRPFSSKRRFSCSTGLARTPMGLISLCGSCTAAGFR
jgi:hypothetical protein